MFFQISAATGGMMKKGEITRMRTIPWPPDRTVDEERDAMRPAGDGRTPARDQRV
jgi:hypothetical protein